MWFRKETHFRAATAVVAVSTFVWISTGANAWAQSQAAGRDPSAALARLAEDPALGLSAEQRALLRAAARSIKPSSGPLGEAPAGGAAAEMRDIGAALDEVGDDEAASAAVTAQAAKRLRQRFAATHQRVLQEFTDTEAQLRSAALPNVIWERHAAAQAEYMERAAKVFTDLDRGAAGNQKATMRRALKDAASALRSSSEERPHQPFDPARMPFRMAEPIERVMDSSTAVPVDAAAPQAASLVPPTADDLAATEDVQITPEIEALAASLQRQPLQIYQWVRNNIEFVPTYGSVQGSQMTLDAKRGNAFDIASLLIALLRASGVAARYVTGTIEVPTAQVMNWVGGAESAKVAQQILGQGGVPNVGLLSGGSVTHIRIDHVWVEAFVDYVPSRGAVHGEGDTWVAMDASFKLHTFTERSELFALNPISAVLDPSDQLFDVDETLGKVTNVDANPLEDRLIDWAEANDEYLITHGGYPSRIEELIGDRQIVPESNSVLPASLPYRLVTPGSALSALPAALRHSVTLNGFGSALDRAFGNLAFSVTLSLPELNSRRLSLQFDPATQADADTLQAARDGGASSLPVYLVNVVPVIELDGVERGRGSSVRMGSAYTLDVVLRAPGGPTTVPYQIVAGDEIVVGVTGNGLTEEVLEKRFAAHPVDNASEYFHQVQMHYWLECDVLANAAAKGRGVHVQRLPSVGFFSSPLSASYFFGAPISGFYQGRGMDVRRSLLGAAGADPATVVEVVKQAGFQGSYLEGAVYDQLRDRSDPRVKGISAVHLINDAMAQGIPVYRVTSANSAAVLPLLAVSSAVKSDVATAVSQGKSVLVPERNVNLGSWAGVGYIIQDEATGAGAYLISGGLAGGWLLDCLKKLLPSWDTLLAIIIFLILVALLIAAILSAPVGAPAFAAMLLFLLLIGGLSGTNTDPTPVT